MADFSSHHLISAYVDDRVSPEERAKVEVLLQSSPEARAELENYRQLRKTLQGLPKEFAPPDLYTRVMIQAEKESLLGKPPATVAAADDKGSLRKRWTVPAVTAVASLGLLVLVMVRFNARPDAPQATSASGLAADSSDSGSGETTPVSSEPEVTTFDDSGAVALNSDEVRDLRRELRLTDQIQIAQEGNSDGVINMLSAYDLRTAEVGDVVDALQMKGDGVAVVQLTVLDRQRFLDNFHVLLSDLNVPQEARRANNYGERRNDYFAVYVEAGEGRFEALMENLQQNMDIEQMYVSTTIPSSDLNSYVADQGYSDLWAMKNQNETAPSSSPGAGDLDEPVADKAADKRDRSETAQRPGVKTAEADSSTKPGRITEAFSRSLTESEFPPPPPVPLNRTPERDALSLAEGEPAPAEGPLPTQEAEALEFSYRTRRVPLRLPAAVGRQLTVPQRSLGQLSLSNGLASDRQIVQQEIDDLPGQRPRQQEPPPSASGNTARPADRPAAPKSRAAELRSDTEKLHEKLAATRPEAAADVKAESRDQPQRRNRSRDARPLQVLFVLTDDASTETVPPAPAEAKQAPQKQ